LKIHFTAAQYRSCKLDVVRAIWLSVEKLANRALFTGKKLSAFFHR